MSYTITRQRLADVMLAKSALGGDITGRGSMLIDNDQAALVAVMDIYVPSALDDAGIDFSCTEKGWKINSVKPTRHQLTAFLADVLRVKVSDLDAGEVSSLKRVTYDFDGDAAIVPEFV